MNAKQGSNMCGISHDISDFGRSFTDYIITRPVHSENGSFL